MPKVTGGPDALNNLLESVYQSGIDAGDSEEVASKKAWSSAKTAGWDKVGDIWKKHSEQLIKKNSSLKNVEIFRTGTWNGDPYTRKDLQRMVKNFEQLQDEGKLEVPMKIGHGEKQDYLEKEGFPAAGWVSRLKLVGDSLLADIKNIPQSIFALIKKKAYRKTSAEIYPSYETSDGTKLSTVLRAVAFLGGEIPAVEGISDILGLYSDKGNQVFKMYSIEDKKYGFTITPRKGLDDKVADTTNKAVKGIVKLPTVSKQPFAGTAAGVPKVSIGGLLKIQRGLKRLMESSQYKALMVKEVQIPKYKISVKN